MWPHNAPTNDHRGVEKTVADVSYALYVFGFGPSSLTGPSLSGWGQTNSLEGSFFAKNKKAPRSPGLIQIKRFYWACLGRFVGFPT
jgi:hypothetical protein